MIRPAPKVVEFWSLPETDVRKGLRALWWSISPEGHLGVVLVHQRHLSTSTSIRGWVGLTPRLPFDATLVIVTDRGARRTPLTGIDFSPSNLALLSGGGFALTGSALNEQTQRGQPTAVVGSTTGERRVLKPFGLGYDIAAVVSDRENRLWTVHGDQGIFGQEPWSQPGLVGWDPEGRRIWTPEGRIPGVVHGISAATEDDAVWALYSVVGNHYTARITPATGDVVSYPTDIGPYDGLAVQGTHAILSARDHDQPSLALIRARRWDGIWVETDRHHLRMPGRVVLRCALGRNETLWLRAGDTWLTAEV